MDIKITARELARVLLLLDIQHGFMPRRSMPQLSRQVRERYLREAGSYLQLPLDEWPNEIIQKAGVGYASKEES